MSKAHGPGEPLVQGSFSSSSWLDFLFLLVGCSSPSWLDFPLPPGWIFLFLLVGHSSFFLLVNLLGLL